MFFDPHKPFNDLPPLPPNFDFDDVDILKMVNKTNIALAKLNGEAKTIPNRELLISPLSFREAVASSKIENIHTTVEDALRTSYLDFSDLTAEQKETIYYREALLKGYNFIKTNKFISTNLIIDIQSTLVPTKPGIRKIPGVKIINTATGEVLYTPPEGENLIRDLLSNLEKYINNIDETPDALIKLAVSHYQFEAIHPFLDGNGRTGRILMVLYLCLVDRLELPILYLSGYINQHKNKYYELLRKVTAENNWKEWTLYILEAIENQSYKTLNTIIEIRNLMDKFREEIKHKKPKIFSEDLIQYLFTFPYYSRVTLMDKLNIKSRNTASKYFNELKAIGLIEEMIHKKEKIYFSQDFLELLK